MITGEREGRNTTTTFNSNCRSSSCNNSIHSLTQFFYLSFISFSDFIVINCWWDNVSILRRPLSSCLSSSPFFRIKCVGPQAYFLHITPYNNNNTNHLTNQSRYKPITNFSEILLSTRAHFKKDLAVIVIMCI